jgi:DNA-binding Xre family transcriptional regulator
MLAVWGNGRTKSHQTAAGSKNITRYRFWQDTGLSRATAYRLCDDPTYIPTGEVIEKICRAHEWQPGEFIVYKPDSE